MAITHLVFVDGLWLGWIVGWMEEDFLQQRIG